MISEKPFSFNTNIPGSVLNPADGEGASSSSAISLNKQTKKWNANSVAKASAHWGLPGSGVFDRIWRISAIYSLVVTLNLTFTMCGKKKYLMY